jgi:hypothetical protein
MDQTLITATRAPDGVRITVYARGGDIVIATTLDPKRALLLGLDLANLAAEPFFTAEAEKIGPGIAPAQTPAGRHAGKHERMVESHAR